MTHKNNNDKYNDNDNEKDNDKDNDKNNPRVLCHLIETLITILTIENLNS